MTPANIATVFAPNLIRPRGLELGAILEYTPLSNVRFVCFDSMVDAMYTQQTLMEMLVVHFDVLLAVRDK
jgi:hypothetical protein